MPNDSENLRKELRGAELEVTALRTELRKALEETQRTREEMRQFIEHLSSKMEARPPVAAYEGKSPAEAVAPPTNDPLTTVPADDGRPYVLYIEDNETSFRMVEQILQDIPAINLRWANCGRAGLAAAQAHIPELILLDLDLPDMHGSEILRTLQKEPATAGIPVIVVSADISPSQIERMLAAGARNYLTKPFDIRRFLVMVEKILETTATGSGAAAAWEPISG